MLPTRRSCSWLLSRSALRSLCAGALCSIWGLPATAQDGPGGAVEITAPAGPSQAALTVRVSPDGQARASACTGGPCLTDTGEPQWSLDASREIRLLGARAPLHTDVLDLGQGRRAVHVRWGDEPSYHLVLAAAPQGSAAPKAVGSKQAGGSSSQAASGPVLLVHQGWSDRYSGLEGERSAPHVEVIGSAGSQQLVVGELREDLSLCGRPALLAPRVLDPASLRLRPARLQRLSATERKRAPELTAEPVDDPTPGGMTLPALAASSAVGRPGFVSDGDLETTWAEGGGGAGRGEFIRLRAPAQVPIRGFELVSRPPSGGSPAGAGPRVFWLAGDTQLVRVEMPSDPWAEPGARFRILLPEPWHTSCVAWIAEEAYGSGADLQVTLAELVALPEAGSASLEELIEWIASGEERAGQAVSLLAARPDAGPAVTAALPQASPRARPRLLDVSDQIACSASAPNYAAALALGDRDLTERASRGLARCFEQAPAALIASLKGATASAETRLAQELAQLAPRTAVEELTPRLAAPSPARRAGLRQALAHAARAPEAAPALRHWLADTKLAERARVDLLRSLGARIHQFRPEASAALARLLPTASFRTRYLLLEPAVRLAAQDDGARAFVARALTHDAHPAVRTQAARAIGEVLGGTARDPGSLPFETELMAALTDENVRVRDGAARTLGLLLSQRAQGRLQELLEDDPWPLVRAAAADSLGRLGPHQNVDRALARALEDDESLAVRAAAARALGERKPSEAGKWLREAFNDSDQPASVRLAVARALGELCDPSAAPSLLEAALRLTNPHLDADERRVSLAALAALGRLRPPDLQSDLKPLLEGRVPRQVRAQARRASGKPSPGQAVCRAPRSAGAPR